MQVTADVKCYYCGHISGQILSDRSRPGVRAFQPRPGYQGARPKPGQRLRCERCSGPVYLEDVTPLEMSTVRSAESLRERERAKLSGVA
jgi:hypothetical protein